jgi:hypothetical protein
MLWASRTGITEFLGLVPRLVFINFTAFLKHDLLSSLGAAVGGTTNWPNRVDDSLPFHLRTETDPVVETLCSFKTLDDEQD